MSYKALDCGTGNFVCIDTEGTRIQRNAFLTIDKEVTTTKNLKRMGVPFVEINGKIYIVGVKAYEYSQVFGTQDLRRPMQSGVLNPTEQAALPVLRLIIGGLLKDSKKAEDDSKENVVYCIPARPIDTEREIDYHEDILGQIINSFGYESRAINEGVALGLAGLETDNLTGIAISLGSGMCNVAIMFKGISSLQFSVSQAGDWIDKNVSRDCGIPVAKAQFIKESGDYTIDPKSTVERTREQNAIKSYYEALIRYILANISAQFESKEMPNFPTAVPIVLGGGTSMVNGFLEVFKTQFTQKGFPLNISEIRLVDEPLTAVARGCYIEAKLEEE